MLDIVVPKKELRRLMLYEVLRMNVVGISVAESRNCEHGKDVNQFQTWFRW